jgi:2,3-dihydroxybenzoate decarboxylase
MVKKIALEEHFLDPATETYWRPTMVDVAPARTAQLYASLTDFGEQRLQMMDKTGIAHTVLAIAGPGVQVERDTATAVRAARASNDFLAIEVQKRPDRYSGFAHLAMQDANAAANELERCVRELKFRGAMINGHTNGKYLDDRSYDPFWERAAALDAPIYLHPADPVAPLPAIAGYNVLARPMWGWGVETGSHALRIISGGVFHRYPNAKLVLGHLGDEAKVIGAIADRGPGEPVRYAGKLARSTS